MKNNGRKIKQLIGPKLGLLRIQKQKTLKQVSKATNIPCEIIDNLECGQRGYWRHYCVLLKYYHYKIDIVPVE